MVNSSADTPTDADRRDAVRAAFVRERGFWAPPFEAILRADPAFLEAYVEFSSVPWRTGPLEPKVKELMYIAADSAVTHMHAVGTAAHVRSALRHGATLQEIASVLALTSLMGLQTLELGVPILLAEGAEVAAGARDDDGQDEDGWLDALDSVDPAGASATRGWIRSVRAASPLEPKVVELVGVAVNASTTHLDETATRRHVRAALAAGATMAEVAEVLELVAVLGIHTATMAMPLLMEELDRGSLSED